jgi:predicted aspartyl protease
MIGGDKIAKIGTKAAGLTLDDMYKERKTNGQDYDARLRRARRLGPGPPRAARSRPLILKDEPTEIKSKGDRIMPTEGTAMGRITLEFSIANNDDLALARKGLLTPDQVRRVALQGVVDTGATRLVLPESAVDQLGLTPSGTPTVRYADRRSASRTIVKNVSVELLGRQGVFTALVEPDRTTALIGAIVMEDLDFLVDCATQTLQPRDPNTIISEVE